MADQPFIEGEIVGETVENLPGLPNDFAIERKRVLLADITVTSIENFLRQLERTGVVFKSAERAGLSYVTVNRLRKDDPVFAELWAEAMQAYRDSLVEECHRRAIEGWDEPQFSQRLGTQMGVVRKFDSRLLELMLKRHIPEFREQFKGEISISGGVLVAPIAPLNQEDWEAKFGGERLKLLSNEEAGITTPEANP